MIKKSKAAIAVSILISAVQMMGGVFFSLFFGTNTVVYLIYEGLRVDAGVGFFAICLIFDAIGIMLVMFSIKRTRLLKEHQKYGSFISSDPTGSITNLAASMGASPDLVKRNLELMIKRKIFVNVHINQETNCIIIDSGENAL